MMILNETNSTMIVQSSWELKDGVDIYMHNGSGLVDIANKPKLTSTN